MGQFGFSVIGLLWLLMLILPNVIWTRFRPAGYDPQGENRLLVVLEKIGQVGVTCTSLFFSDTNWQPLSPWSLWLAASLGLMLLYEGWWIRYFRSSRTLRDFYSSFCGIPVAGALLPVAAFLLLGIYGRLLWLILFAVVLGVGHVGIHLQHRRELNR